MTTTMLDRWTDERMAKARRLRSERAAKRHIAKMEAAKRADRIARLDAAKERDRAAMAAR